MNNKLIVPSGIIIPEGISLTKWSCVACDQFTSDKNYWYNVENLTKDCPSTYNLILPEAFLQSDNSEKINSINSTFDEYINQGIFNNEYFGYVLTVRKTSYGVVRVGIVLAVNLEEYSYNASENLAVKSTEGTVISRIPPRVKIRENAPCEIPHIMLLCDDDSENGIIEKLYKNKEKLTKIYDFELNMEGGHIEGYHIPAEIDLDFMFKSIAKNNLVFAVGDGNHSLATAKSCYENLKKSNELKENDKRQFALCEVVNLNSSGITFEPIHRIVTGVDVENFTNGLKEISSGNSKIQIHKNDGTKEFPMTVNVPECYTKLQNYIDNYLLKFGGEVDYIHGLDVLLNLSKETKSVGIVMPKLEKSQLFDYIANVGELPRKTFSMGDASEKRYYLETRKIY